MLTIGYRETKQKTLEEVAAAFGDKVVLLDENGVAVEGAAMQDKVDAVQVESAHTVKVQEP